MRRSFSAASFLVVAILCLSSNFAQHPVRSKDVIAEGVIVAFQKDLRYRAMPDAGGPVTFVEFWIVRIDKWPYHVGKLSEQKYILVKYRLYERALTDCEINANRLRFTLRQERENEPTDCLGSVPAESPEGLQLSHYELTTPGKGQQIPPLLRLPCLIVEQGPVVISDFDPQ